jgi:uncharacterized protein (TIGR02453 family)
MSKQTDFDVNYIKFFIGLAQNNHKDWMDANRATYLNAVKGPFEAFVNKLIAAFKDDYQLGDLTASECIFRLNRDIRFSKDKTPYKIQMSALIKKGGKKNMNEPGLYIEIGPEFVNLYSGAYLPNPDQLEAIRHKMAQQPDLIKRIVNEKAFKMYFGEVLGETSKRISAELKSAAIDQPLLFHKQFYILHQLDAEVILEPTFLDQVKKVFKAAGPFNQFLYQLDTP